MTSDSTASITFLHGFLGTADDWRPIIDAPAFAKYATHPMNLPTAESKDGSPAEWQIAVDAIASQLSPRTILIGYSMGARVALAVALTAAARTSLRGLVFVSGTLGIPDEERATRSQHDLALSQQLLRIETDGEKRDFLNQWYRQPIFANLSDEQIAKLVRYRQGFDPVRQSRLMRTYTVSKQPSLWERLGELSVPTLVITGIHDAKYTEIGGRFARQCPRAKLNIVPNAGHNVQRENPDAFIECVSEFAAAIAQRPQAAASPGLEEDNKT